MKNIVIYTKAGISFFIPFAAAAGIGVKEFTGTHPSLWAIIGVTLAALSAGATGLNSFLSRSYADHQDEQAATAPQVPPPANPGTMFSK